MVTIKLYGPLAALSPATNVEGLWEADCAGQSIAQALSTVDFGGANYITLVNNMREDREYVLQPGDQLGVMPLLAGG